MKKHWLKWLDPIISTALLLIIWQVYITQANVPGFMLPSPLKVLQEIAQQLTGSSIWYHIAVTSIETLSGFLLAVLLGIASGYAIYKSENLRITVMPFLIFFQVAPKIALVPIFIIWFGLGFFSKVIVVFSMVYFPIVLGMLDGLQAIPKDMRDFMKILGADRKQLFRSLEIPYALPALFAAFKIGIVQALIGATVAEWMSGQSGLGYLQTFASSTFNTPLLMAGIFFTIALGLLFYEVIQLLERRLLSWKEE